MRRVTIAVIGNGKTSRANVEALLSDFLESVDKADLAVLANHQSEAATWAIQFAESKGVDVHTHPDLATMYKGMEDIRFFLAWDDEDPMCQDVSAFSQEHNIPMFDLTNGLVRINIKAEKIEPTKPSIMPEVETQTNPHTETKLKGPAPVAIIEVDEDEDDEDEDDDEEYEDDLGTLFTEAFEEAARVMALVFVDEVKRLLKEEKDAK